MRKVLLTCLAVWLIAPAAFSQTEVLKGVANNLAFYKQKKDLKYLSAAQITVDSVLKAAPDTSAVEPNVYKAVVYSSILYVDSLNKLNEPTAMLPQTAALVDRLANNRKIYRFQAEIDYSKRCLANVYIRKAFVYIKSSDFISAMPLLRERTKICARFQTIKWLYCLCEQQAG